MGGRGSNSTRRGRTGGVDPINVSNTSSLISAREDNKRVEVDQTLQVMRDVFDDWGVDVTDAQLAKLSGADAAVMAYYDGNGNIAVNQAYFDSDSMDRAYDGCVASGFHPPRGNKTGLEAVIAHELGHRITEEAGRLAGYGDWQLDRVGREIINEAANARGTTPGAFQARISGYARQNSAEAVAEAYADVYCNGNNAREESQIVVNILRRYFSLG